MQAVHQISMLTTAASGDEAQVPEKICDGNQKGWLPISLRRPYLLSLSTVLMLMAVVIEVLRQYSLQHDGIVKYKRKEDLSSTAWRVRTDTPTILSLFAMVLWEVCAQDVLRLEPYFQLSRLHGAPASLLFVNYRFDAGILAPIRAARNRHWIVLCVSLMSLLIRALLPSLLSGLIILLPVSLLETKTIDTWPYLVDLDTQWSWFSAEAAYGDLWTVLLGDNSGSYHSSRFATAPVSNPLDYGDEFSILTLNQSVYWSNMTCLDITLTGLVPSAILHVNATTDLKSNPGFSWDLHNITLPEEKLASGCRTNIEIDGFVPRSDGHFQARYWEPIQYSPITPVLSAFSNNDCSPDGFLGVMIDMETAAGKLLHTNVTAFACQPVYRQAMATVSLTWNSTITSVEIISSTVKDLTREEFSIHGLQRLIFTEHVAAKDQQELDGLFVGDTPTISSQQSGQSRVAVIGDSDILHLTQYQEKIGRLWNDAFITSINRFFDPVAGVFHIGAEIAADGVSLMAVSQTAFMVEIILVLCSFLLLSLSWIYPRRPNLLLEDPGSIAAQCAWIARLIRPETLQLLCHPKYHQARTRDLQQWAKVFWCEWRDGPRGRQIEICSRNGCHVKTYSAPFSTGRPDPMPHFLMLPWFAIECILLVGTVIAFGLAFKFMQFENQESFSATEVRLSSIFLVYGPTVLASFIYTLLTSIHRHLIAAEPWIRLRRGIVSPQVLLTPSHGPLTILLEFLQSRSRVSTTILALSFLCLLNLVLVIVSGGLFEPQLNDYIAPIPNLTMLYDYSMFLKPELKLDFKAYDSVIYSLTGNVSSTPWTTTDFSFLPLEINEPVNAKSISYTATTRGIGTYLDCAVLPRHNAYIDYEARTINWTYTLSEGPANILCSVQLPLDDNEIIDQRTVRYIWPHNADPLCERLSFFVFTSWMNSTSAPLDEHTSMALHCEPTIKIQDFHIHFNSYGMVQGYKAIVDSSIISGTFFENASEVLEEFNQGFGRFVRNLYSTEYLAFYQSTFLVQNVVQVYDRMNPDGIELDHDAWIRAVQSVYRVTFSKYLSLCRDQLFSRTTLDTAVPVDGTMTYTMWSFMPSNAYMIIIIALISIDILAIVVIFLMYYRKYDAPRIPKSPGSLIPWIAQSHMLQEIKKSYNMDEEEKTDVLLQDGRQYHFSQCSATDSEKIWMLDYVERTSIELSLITPSHRANDVPNTG